MLTPNELVLTFRGSYVCANFGENRSRNATVSVLADGQTDRHTQVNSALHPSGVAKSSTSFGWGKGGKGVISITNCYIRLTYLLTHTQTQTDFIICPILYAIAMGQITK